MRLWGTYVPPPNYIDAKGIFDGARRFAFLLETARPGTFPDAPLIAAIMHLVSYRCATIIFNFGFYF